MWKRYSVLLFLFLLLLPSAFSSDSLSEEAALKRLKEIFRQQRIELSLLTQDLSQLKSDSVDLRQSLKERERILLRQQKTIESLENTLRGSEDESKSLLVELERLKIELQELQVLLQKVKDSLTAYSRKALRDKILIGAGAFAAGALIGLITR